MQTVHQYPFDQLEKIIWPVNFCWKGHDGKIQIIPFLSERIQESDELDWPPEQKERFLIWGPSFIEESSFQLLKIHKLILFKKLEAKMGLFSEINLWDWHWKDVLLNYASNVLTKKTYRDLIKLDPIIKDYSQYYNQQLNQYMHLLSKALPGRNGTWEELENIYTRIGRGSILSDEEHSTLSKLIEVHRAVNKSIDYNKACCAIKQAFNQWNGRSCNNSSNLNFENPYWDNFMTLVERGCPADLWSDCGNHFQQILVSRLALWWGWRDAPFTCMAKLIASHLESMIREGYLLREVNKGEAIKYQLSEDGYRRLKDFQGPDKKNIFGWLRSVDLAATSKEIILNAITDLF